ncbi:phosphonate C-P lyase system protein PhnG [Desertibaculum subflavum]|uniref:phosphonate C-P lyase system protein PhnG n=1 Tax=Desertibaculum subflavum TaxID=2268458 RepID=UPI000E6756DD
MAAISEGQSGTGSETAARQRWLAVLARTPRERLEAALSELMPAPRYRPLKPAEAGLVMVRGRAGGTGSRFNLGEMTVTRAAIALEEGPVGIGYVPGRDRRRAELVAVFDALLQLSDRRASLMAALIEPQAAEIEAARANRAAKVAATRVSFFTMVRGE